MLVERMTLTEKEHIKLVEVGNSFWDAFSKLVAKHVEKMPPELETKTLYYLQDKASVFGSDYERHLKKVCKLCGYQHGHSIGCENNPVDIALKNNAKRR